MEKQLMDLICPAAEQIQTFEANIQLKHLYQRIELTKRWGERHISQLP